MFSSYLVRRLLRIMIIFFLVLNFQFIFFRVINPVNPVQWVISKDFTADLVERLRKLYGLDQPLYVQYVKYLENMLTLNLGVSFRTQRPVINSLLDYLPNTLALVLSAVVIQIVIGIAAGLYAASRHGKIIDFSITGLALLMYAMPPFLVFLAARYIFAEKLGWFPVLGTIISPPTNPALYLSEYMYRMALPLTTLVIAGLGSWAFFTRNLSMDVLTQDFIQTAKAKGVEGVRGKMIFRHILPAILPPIVSLVAISLPSTIFGSIVTEYIFTWKGIGWWYLNSIWTGDYPATQGLFLVYTFLLLGSNFLADIFYGYLDPRIRVGTRR